MYPTKNELAERYERASDEKLLYIVHNPREYTTDAVDVAKGVLAEGTSPLRKLRRLSKNRNTGGWRKSWRH